MITRSEAEAVVLERLNASTDAAHRAVIPDAWNKPYEWVVFCDSEGSQERVFTSRASSAMVPSW
jgi:hypothetical protein